MKKPLSTGMLILLLSHSIKSYSYTTCDLPLQEAIFNEDFFSMLSTILAPFLLVGLLIGGIYYRIK